MRDLKGPVGALVAAWSAAAVLLHLYFAGFGFPEPLKLASLHLALFVPLVFLLYPARASQIETSPSLVDWFLAVLSIIPSAYVWLNTDAIYDRSAFIDPLGTGPLLLGIVMTSLVLEAVRRAISPTLAALAGVVIVYMFVSEYLPGSFYYRHLPTAHVVEIMYLINGSGLYGSLTGMSATVVSIFLIFGAFMQVSGMGRLFNNFGAFVAGGFVGGPAKVAVISSALFGTMSGSSVANVAVTGSMSIPLMKRMGYRPTFAAAVEAASSVGGAIMPPVMGAAAFVMAEMIARPYADIMKAAALGAVLYYLGILLVVHFESKRLGVRAMPREELPKGRDLLRDAHLVLPLGLLVVLMSARFSSYFAAFWSVVALVLVAGLRAHTRMGQRKILEALVGAGKTIAVLSVAIAAAGIITAGLTNTGLLLAFMGLIRDTAGGSLLLLVLLVAATCLFLGTGIPTTPAYIVTSAIGAPLLAEHGIPLLAIHLFVFYFAVLADASPPVAPAADVAAAIAGAPPLRTGMVAFRLATGGFITGIAFIYEPALILNGTLFEIVSIFLAIAGGLALLAIADTGYADAPLATAWRWVFLAAGLFCGLAHTLPAWQRALLALAILAFIKLRTLAQRKAEQRLALTANTSS